MDLSTLNSGSKKRQARKRVGRGPGSGTGKTAGKGHKGARARAGFVNRPAFEGGQMPLHRRLPKRGFWHDDRFPCQVVNLDELEKAFEGGAEVTLETLVACGLAKAAKGGVKVLGRGELKKKLNIKVNAVSASAKTKIEAAGGTVEIIQHKPKAPAAAEEA